MFHRSHALFAALASLFLGGIATGAASCSADSGSASSGSSSGNGGGATSSTATGGGGGATATSSSASTGGGGGPSATPGGIMSRSVAAATPLKHCSSGLTGHPQLLTWRKEPSAG